MRRVFFRKLRLLTNGQPFLFPLQLRSDEEVDVERPVLMKVDRVGILGVVLHPSADAAPEGLFGRRKGLERAGPQRDVVAESSSSRVLRGQYVVVKAALVKIHFLDRRLPREQVARQLEHV